MGVGKIEKEIWKSVDGFEGFYQVSNLGRVRSLDRRVLFSRKGKICNRIFRGKLLKLTKHHTGYNVVSLLSECFKKQASVHRLVAMAFIENPENKEEVNHINGIKTDNRVENLEWTTRKENNDHAIEIGLTKVCGSSNNNAKLTEKDVVAIVNLLKGGASVKSLADEFGVQKPAIWKIQHGYKWSHVTGIQKH